MSVSSPDPNKIARMLDWLSGDPPDDCEADLAALRLHLGELTDPSDALVAVPADVLAMIAGRALDVADRFKPRLLAMSLPLPAELHNDIVELVGALLDVVEMCRNTPDADSSGEIEAPSERVGLAMRLLGEAWLIGSMGGIDMPARLWGSANRLLFQVGDGELLEVDATGGAADVVAQYKRMAAMAVLQPESLTARELSWLFDYLDGVAAAAELTARPIQPVSGVFWIDLSHAGPPVAQSRLAPPLGDALLYFRALGLARRAGEQIDWLESRIGEAEIVGLERDGDLLEPDSSGLPLGLTPVEVVSMLRRMRDGWTTPASRVQPRRSRLYSVQVCQGLREIWRMHRSGRASKRITEWRVFNESPGGYAIISVGGVEGVLSAGMALALRRGPGEPWTICIVRWLRNDRSDQVELGLQVVAEGCISVSVAFRGSELGVPAPALLLPPHAARRDQAILAPAGTYNSRRFVLIREGERLYVAQGRVLSLDMQTANVELFQYEIDPYPI